MNKKRIMSIILAWVIVFTSVPTISYEAQAKTKSPVLSNKKIFVKKGKKKTVKLKNVTKKVYWKIVSGSKKIKIVKKSGKYNQKVQIKAKGKGNAVIVALHGKKIYTLKVTVTDKKVIVPESTTKQEETTPKIEPTTEEKVEYAKVTFLGIDKSVIFTMEYPKGKPYGSFPRIYEESYLFLGWHMESDIGKRVKEDDICMEDIILYAKFIRPGTIEPAYENVEE